MVEIPVELADRRYVVHLGAGALARLRDLRAERRGGRTVVVSSRRVWRLHGARVARAFGGGIAGPVLLPDGERFKSRRALAAVHDAFLAAGLARDGLVVAVGGGVVGDLAGFAAATYMRGVSWVPVPTTLLAMVDSAIGGKVAVNHPRAKNLLGAFHQPLAVVSDPAFLDTLPSRERRSGAFEVLKCAVLADRALFEALAAAPPGEIGGDACAREDAIGRACRIKADVVSKDEREGGRRRVLNLGHTLGHAFEAVTRYRRLTHGEAVGWGLIGAAALARDLGRLAAGDFTRIAAAVDHLGPRPPVADLAPADVLDALARDKKARAGRVPFILPTAIGRVAIADDVPTAAIRHVLRELGRRPSR